MKKKLISILFCILLIIVAIIPSINADVHKIISSNSNNFSNELSELDFYNQRYSNKPLRFRYLTYDGEIQRVTKTKSELLAVRIRSYKNEGNQIVRTDLSIGNHPPIYIDSNDDFTFENGVTGGSGTENDPYIIENWVIVGDGSVENGIYVQNTEVFFIIRNCSISNFLSKYDSGIKFDNLVNGAVDSSDCFGNYYGIYVHSSSHVNVNNSKFHDNLGSYSKGIYCYRSSYITITFCRCYNNSGYMAVGIYLWGTSNSKISGTHCYDNDLTGIEVSSFTKEYPVRNITIENCTVYNNAWGGISIGSNYRSWPNRNCYFHITGCQIYNNGHVPGLDNAFPGIEIGNAHYFTIENCHINGNGWGIQIDLSSNNLIRNCSVHNNWEPGFLGVGISPGGWPSGLMFSINNTIENCDIYDNPIGIWLEDTFKATIKNNKITHNNITGIQNHAWDLVTTASIKNNNICDNGWEYPEYSWGITAMRSILDLRNNWWGAENGPLYRYNSGDGDFIEWFLSFLIIRPWAKEPIPNVGVQD